MAGEEVDFSFRISGLKVRYLFKRQLYTFQCDLTLSKHSNINTFAKEIKSKIILVKSKSLDPNIFKKDLKYKNIVKL